MSKKERTLSPAERKRKEHFQVTCEEMEGKGYRRKDLTVGILRANVMSLIVMLPFVVLAGWIYLAVNPLGSFSIKISLGGYGIFLLALIILVVTHEGIHGLTWGLFAQGHFRSIQVGVIWKSLTPYCTCSAPLKRWQYLLGGAMPTLILGFGLAAVGIGLGSFWIFVTAQLMVLSGGGDFFIMLKLMLYRPTGQEALYFDHPYECGLVVFERDR